MTRWSRRPEFFAYWTYWLIVVIALSVCIMIGAFIGGWLGGTIGAIIYITHEVGVIYFSWQPWREQ